MRADSAITDPGYVEALGWLYHLSPNVRTAAQIVADHPRKLARMRALLDVLGRPDRSLTSVLVAGTKGKGSVSAYTEAILRSAGLRVGMVTSPHLTSWCERTRIAGEDVDPATAARLLPVIRAAVERMETSHPELGHVTTFEAGFAFALVAFVEAGVELAVVEAGVGGRHDATNVLDPLAVALTAVSYDHTATLGPTLTDIAEEKVGVFRAGRLAISAEQPAEVRAVVEEAAAASAVRLEVVGADWCWQPADDRDACGSFAVRGPRGPFSGLATPLLGRHQRENACVAVALATDTLASTGCRAGSTQRASQVCAPTRTAVAAVQSRPKAPVEAAVRQGLATVRWPGRLQVLRREPLLVVDGAHNGDSAVRLAEAVRECFGARRRHLVLGTSVGKDIVRMLDALLPLAQTVTLTRSHHERSVPLDELARQLEARQVQSRIVPEVREAIDATLALARPDDLVLVTGSLFVVGEALESHGGEADDAVGGVP